MNFLANLGPHANFILAAYGVTALTLGALIVWVSLDYRAQRKTIRDLESQKSKR
jgi:heme exporter protein D